jgi:predicted PurR-regulated permease PerM
MATPGGTQDQSRFLTNATEATIRIAGIALLAVWCFQILAPFIIPVAWGVIIATAIYPAFNWLQQKLGGRQGLTAALIALFGILLIVVPAIITANSFVESVTWLATGLRDGTLEVPPPPDNLQTLPFVGERLHAFWSLANQSVADALITLGPHIGPVAGGLLQAAAGLGMSMLQFIISICIAAALLANAEGGTRTAHNVGSRIFEGRGEDFVNLAASTIRGVTQGILGVAVIQAGLLAIGFYAIGLPHASLWSVIVLLLAVVQLPALLVVAPIIIYVFSSSDSTGGAVVFTIWSLLAGASDNVLKPILLGRGLDLPMLVIFMGAIGGFITSGFIGLFVGAVVLALGYKLFMAWLGIEAEEPEAAV